MLSRPLSPSASVTLRVTLKVPGAVKLWTGFCNVLLVPSSKSQKYDKGASPVPVPLNWTVRLTSPAVVFAVIDAVAF